MVSCGPAGGGLGSCCFPLAPGPWPRPLGSPCGLQSPDGAPWIPGPSSDVFFLSSASRFWEIRLRFSPPRAEQGRDGGARRADGGASGNLVVFRAPPMPSGAQIGSGMAWVQWEPRSQSAHGAGHTPHLSQPPPGAMTVTAGWEPAHTAQPVPEGPGVATAKGPAAAHALSPSSLDSDSCQPHAPRTARDF